MPSDGPETATVLIVDDEPTNVRLLERLLGQAGYAHVHGTTDPRECLALFASVRPDLVLLDLHMPHRDGFQLIEDLRGVIPAETYVPILVLTADVDRTALRRALRAGAKDFLTKPFDAEEVLLRIRNLLETRALHVAVQAQNQVLEARVEERTRQLLQMEKLSAMGQLLAGVAHELNNPLTVVAGQALLLRDTPPGPAAIARAGKIATAADRCVRIVRNFLALARERPPERSRVILNRVVEDAVELLTYELRTSNVQVTLTLAPDVPTLWADPNQLHQVVVNLVANAHHALLTVPQNRELRLTTRAAAGNAGAELVVADTGSGIPPAVRDRIFDPFFTTKPPGQGTGLGLSLVHGIIQDHAGRIRVESEPGAGTTFTIDLPVGVPPVVVSAPAAATGFVPAAQSRDAQRILVVDDEGDVAELLVEILEADGFQVDRVGNGAEGLARLEQQTYDVILSDTQMPVLDGLAFFKEIERRYPALRRRIAFVSGDVLNAEKRAFVERAGVPLLAKPFDRDQVRQTVQRLLENAV
jgi:signal transduction histidine kinase